MIIKNGKVFIKGGSFIETTVRFGEKIVEIGSSLNPTDGETCIDAGGNYVIPGLVDIHTHGAMGHDVCDATPKSMQAISDFYAANGITSFCPTTMTLPEERLTPIMRNIATSKISGARCVGINMEGPFVSISRAGAQPKEHITEPSIDMFRRLNKESGGQIKLVDIAPEHDTDLNFTRTICRECHVSFAHSETSYETAMEGFASGADHVTHLFNAMSPLNHIKPGLVGAAIDSGAYVEVICDGHHIHPSIIKTIFKMFSHDKICFISDSLRCAGMPDGEYNLAGQKIFLKDGAARLEAGNLAGSAISLMESVRRAVRFGIPLEKAVAAASINPATSIDMEKSIGVIAPGANADIVILNASLDVQQVFIGGQTYKA